MLSEDQKKAISFVKEFEERTRRFEWIVNTDKALSIIPVQHKLNRFQSRFVEAQDESLGTILANSLRYFRNITEQNKLGEQALICKKWIDYAWDQGVILEGQGITGKLKECEKEVERLNGVKTSLENQLTVVSNKNTKLENEKKSLKSNEAKKTT